MKWIACIALATAVMVRCHSSYGAEKTIEWYDAMDCKYSASFDAKKYDAQSLKNTIDVVVEDAFEFPIPQSYLDQGASSVSAYSNVCAEKISLLATIPLISVPGVEDYRNAKLDQLKDWCDFGTHLIRGHLGDAAALRDYTPSASQCSRFVDGLEGKAIITEVWREVVTSSCARNSTPDACRAKRFAAEGGPGGADRIRNDVLTDGWQNCSTLYLKVNHDREKSEAMRMAVEREFRSRLKVKKRPCSD